ITMQEGKKVYLPNTSGDILGEAQWQWLENELKNSTADVHIICTSIQIIPEQHRFEKWSNFPKARERMFALVQRYKPGQVVFISGDRHIAEVSAMSLP
ncbi:MAG: alkaline phosphatase D family protein, partial [Chitinophagales bacterium]